MRTTIAAKLYISFGVMAALVAGSAAVLLYETKSNYESLSHHTRAAVLLAHAQDALWRLRYGFPQFMVGDAPARAAIVADEAKWSKQISQALDDYEAMDISQDERRALATLREVYNKYVEARPQWFALYGSGKVDEAADWRARTTTPLDASLVKAFSDLLDMHQKESATTEKEIASSADTTHTVVLLFVILSLITAGLVAYFITRSIVVPLKQLVGITEGISKGDFTRRIHFSRQDELGTLANGFNDMLGELTVLVGEVQRSGIQVNTSVTEIATTAKQQQATATEIAATTTEIGATSKEISATSKELVKTMNEISGMAEQSASLASGGHSGLTRMEESMRHIMDAAASINSKLTVLNEKAGNINQVVTTITKVADQTNLLSLNAAIEAEKAGEYGRGFAVVATEIRRLADQTAVATYDIEQMVKEIQSAVSAGVMGMDKFSEEVRRGMREIEQVGSQLSQIIQQVEALAPRCEAVNEGMQAHATGAEQITEALGQLSQAAQQTVDSLRQSSQALDGLNQVSADLRSGVSRFKLVA
jgi:methyl-accepting chemotaxis protein WspA